VLLRFTDCSSLSRAIWRGFLLLTVSDAMSGLGGGFNRSTQHLRYCYSRCSFRNVTLQRCKVALPSLKGIHSTSNSLIARAGIFQGHNQVERGKTDLLSRTTYWRATAQLTHHEGSLPVVGHLRAVGGVHIRSYGRASVWLWEAAMPLTGPIPEGRSFFSPRRGASIYLFT
jgi:hypothetical protein